MTHFPPRLHLLAICSLTGGSCSNMCLSDVCGHSHSLEQGVRGDDRIPPPRAVHCGRTHAQVSEQNSISPCISVVTWLLRLASFF